MMIAVVVPTLIADSSSPMMYDAVDDALGDGGARVRQEDQAPNE